MTREEIIRAAVAMVGTRYRRRGRTPGVGLDCAGLVIAVGAALGVRIVPPRDYRLATSPARVALFAARSGLVRRTSERWMPGSVVVIRGTWGHVGIADRSGYVHADLLSRRVVRSPRRDEALVAVLDFPGVTDG